MGFGDIQGLQWHRHGLSWEVPLLSPELGGLEKLRFPIGLTKTGREDTLVAVLVSWYLYLVSGEEGSLWLYSGVRMGFSLVSLPTSLMGIFGISPRGMGLWNLA